MTYVIAIPTYNRYEKLVSKTLQMLKDGGVKKSKIFIFVANKKEYEKYNDVVPSSMYNEIIIGKKGIKNQRVFISKYFPEGKHIVSIDDDVEKIEQLKGGKLQQIKNVDKFFSDSFKLLKKEKLYIWGVYPVHNPFFMKNNVSFGLKFLIGVLFGYINRHDSKLYPKTSVKEDFEQSILFYKMDGGVVRYNNIVPKTVFFAKGGVGIASERIDSYKKASHYLSKKYPDYISSVFTRDNGLTEVKLANFPRKNNVVNNKK